MSAPGAPGAAVVPELDGLDSWAADQAGIAKLFLTGTHGYEWHMVNLRLNISNYIYIYIIYYILYILIST